MNCPFCSRVCEVTRESGPDGVTTFVRCPVCSEKPPAPDWARILGASPGDDEDRDRVTDGTISWYLERLPTDPATTTEAVQALWDFGMSVWNAALMFTADPRKIACLNDVRHALAVRLRVLVENGGGV